VVAGDRHLTQRIGELDLATAPHLSAAVAEHGDAKLLVLDMTPTTFMDSTGVRLIARCYANGPVAVTASPTVRFLLEILAMDDVLATP